MTPPFCPLPSRPPRRRRIVVGTAALLPLALLARPPRAAAADDAFARLRAGGVVLLLRHAATEPGVGDPPGYRLGDCATQRNLSAEGRAQAQRIGARLASEGLAPAAVRSSRWCRCLDTARLAFGRAEPWDALDSFFDARAREPAQTRRLRDALAKLADGRFEAWVTHQVNIGALAGEAVGTGVALVVDRDARVVARLAPE